MFGTVRPRACALPTEDRAAWRRLYCGTCKGLHAYGTPARALTSWDAVLLGAVIEGVQATAGPCGTCRCPLNPLMHRDIVAPDSVATQTSAAVQVLLADAWLADHAEDEYPTLGWVRPWVPSERAAEALDALGIDPEPFGAITARQAAVESTPGVGPTAASGPTADLLQTLFRALVDLPGTAPPLKAPSAARSLGRLGADLGRTIYLIDALEDLGKDTRSGAFNPCLEDGRPDVRRVDEAIAALEGAVGRLGEGVCAFPWSRNRALLEQTIVEELPRRARRAIAAGRRASTVEALAVVDQGWFSSGWSMARRWLSAPAREPEDEPVVRRRRRESCCGACGDACVEPVCCTGCCDCVIDCGPGDSGCINCCPLEALCCCDC